MSDVDLSNTNPIPLTAVVTGSSTAGYSVQVQYGSPPTTLGELSDTFAVLPGTLTIDVGSSTVPNGYTLMGRGGGTWSNTSPSTLVGTLTLTQDLSQRFDFTISVHNDEGRMVARIDPRIIVKKLSM